MPTLQGKKVNLRTVEKKDIPSFLQWYNDPEVIQYLQFYLPLSELAEEKWYERISLSRDEVVFVIEAIIPEGEPRPIGTCGLHRIDWKDRCTSLGIAIGEIEFWNSGCGTEAAMLLIDYCFNQLNLNRVESSVYDFNGRSLRLHEKLGLKEEGRRRKAIYKNGRYVDVITFGLLKEEWEV